MKVSTLGLMATIGLVTLTGTGASAATIYSANDWYAQYSQLSSITNGGTTSPTVNYATTGTGFGSVWSYFAPDASPVALESGMSMTLNTAITVVYQEGVTPVAKDFRFGLFNSGTRPSTPGSRIYTGSTSTFSNFVNGWTGFMTSNVQSQSTSNQIWRRDDGATGTAYSSSGNTTRVGLTDGFSALTLFPNNGVVSLSLTLQRAGDDLSFYGSLGGETFSGVYANAFAGGYPVVFDSVGFWGATEMGGLSSVTLAGTTVTVVPEPAVSALLVGALGSLYLLRRRSRVA
jgi:hypothetical protein